ncbi:MAG: NUMOD4 motif-containing HNH endonuclease [Clostridia bacterium]|nr:NUMOD4 motif-containing HNH endonuclease [Clostridia bacterium]
MLKKEEWKVIKDFPRYQISSYGRVKSLIGEEKLLQPFRSAKGYLSVKLSRRTGTKGKYDTKTFKVHRLVAEYFCENYSGKIEVHHKNRDKRDNRAENLCCLTKKEHAELHKKLLQQEQKENAAA